ncbi:putative Protein tyrosine kinase [Blattamonas nauphoetae]|uniref:Protein kinase domain-containing protein n=1 Tax=Blattamonas nauphoetae TaxID=2049346 RepID=A0ABQ9XWB4_9EUKA|nr:putative Protein tyrosine kinase [Blattamonas nauphoetae]
MKNLVFSTSSSNSNTVKLINVLVTGNRIDLTTKSDAWEGTYSVDTPDSLWGCDTSTGVNTSLLVYLIQPGSKIDVDGTNGKDIEQCGHFGVSCLTIEKGIGRATAADSAKQINIKDATPLSTSISPNAVALTITGETQMRQIKIAAGGQFVISDGSLTLKLLAFVASVDSFSNSLITVSSTGSLSVTSCSFSGFSSTAASILTATIATSKSVIFSDTTFTTCNSTGTARSGVLDVSMVEGSEFSITHSSNPFITCSSSDCSADCVFVSHPTLSKTVVNNILKFGWDQTSPSSRDFVGKEGNHAIPVPLSLYFLTLPTSTFISADSNDVSVCGFAEYPCASLTALHGRIKDTPDTAITFNTNVEHSTELAFTKSVSFSGNEKTMTIKETAATAPGTALFSLAANTQITSLFVAVPSTFKHASVFHSLSASLTIENCSFTQSGTGSIVGTLIQIKSGASLTLRTTFFVSISSASEKAGVIIADVSDSAAFVLNNNTFTSCSCTGQAHSIFISLENTTEVTSSSFNYEMKNLVFSKGTSNSNTKKQIDVFLTGDRIDLTTKSDDWEGTYSVDTPDSLWGSDTSTGMNTSLLPYLVDLEGGIVEVDDKGYEFEKCGHFYLYCKTLSLGIIRMGSSNTINTIKVIDSIEVDSNISLKGTKTIVGDQKASTLTFTHHGVFENKVQSSESSSLTFRQLTISVPTTTSNSVLFTSSSGILEFDDCSFIAPASSELAFSLISATGGSLELSSVTAEKFTLTSTPLISSSAPVTIEHSSFASITRKDGLGCVLEATKSEEGPVKVTDTSFTSCTSSNRRNWILLIGKHPNTVDKDSWKDTITTSMHRQGVLLFIPAGNEDRPSASDPYEPHSLLYEFYPHNPGLIVVTKDEWNEDHPLCGHSQLPCLTVDKAVSLTLVRNVEINGEGEINSAIKLDGDFLTVQGHKKKGLLRMRGKGQLVNNVFNDPDTLLITFVTLDLSSSSLTTSDALIVNENGETELVSVTISSTVDIQPSILRLTGGASLVTNLTISSLVFSSNMFDLSNFETASFVEVTLSYPSKHPQFQFLTAKDGGDLHVKSCSFSGESSSSNEDADTSNVCDWTMSVIDVQDTPTKIEFSSFLSLPIGAVAVSGGSLTIDGASFQDNSAQNTSFPSVRRNVRCSNAQVNVTTLHAGDGAIPGSSSWFYAEEGCSVVSSVINPLSPFFIPTLNKTETKVSYNKKSGQFTVSIAGLLLIPCGLELEVFEFDDKTKRETGTKKIVDFSETTPSKWTETALTVVLTESSLTKSINSTFEWRARLNYGNAIATTEYITLKQSAASERKSFAQQSMKIIIPIAASVAALLVLLLLIFLCCRRRKQKAKKDESQQLLTNQELDVGIEIKVDDLPTFHNIDDNGTNHFQTHTHMSTWVPATKDQDALEKDENVPQPESFSPDNMVEAMGCGEKKEIHVVDRRNTLYSRLHSNNKDTRQLQRFQVQFRVARGLEQLSRSETFKDLLLKLNPHNIIITETDDVFLKLKEDAPRTVEQPTQNQTNVTSPKDDSGQRWMAPEAVTQSATEVKAQIDHTKAAVFSLGLVLWEIETGDVPFGEIDGINAQRQLGTGTRPKMDKLPSDLKDLVEQCLDLDPKLRPSFSTIYDKLIDNGKATKQITSSNAESYKQQLEAKQRQLPHYLE